jgi:hypothetical protein
LYLFLLVAEPLLKPLAPSLKISYHFAAAPNVVIEKDVCN